MQQGGGARPAAPPAAPPSPAAPPGTDVAGFYAQLVGAGAPADDTGSDAPGAVTDAAAAPGTGADAAAAAAAGAAAAGVPHLRPVRFAAPVVLDPNIGVVTLPPASDAAPAARHRRGGAHGAAHPAHPAAPSAIGASARRPIDRGNVGYRLLQKAGWTEGRGLGAAEQGMAAPLAVVPQKGSTGLGFGAAQAAPQQAQQGGGAAAGPAAPPQPAGPVLGGRRVAALVAAELAAESLDAKVARHRQVMAAEARDARDREVQRLIFRAFSDGDGGGGGGGAGGGNASNPLVSGNHRLTATNPLLDDSDDGG
ncbi:hypothetical protein HT031_001412 [Scenedesmus sp. PABB004]|nr:hypothetical protein HT031_001412 [Scenedesmus sp. PABB004]